MYKLILFTLLSVFFMMLHAYQVDQELAMHSLFQAKYALNRSTHAAAQQLDMIKLSNGVISIDDDRAMDVASNYLQKNLKLDSGFMPMPNTFLNTRVDILVFEVINEDQLFPYVYTNLEYDYKVTIQSPSVIMIIRVDYPRTFTILGPITWNVKGTAEAVHVLN